MPLASLAGVPVRLATHHGIIEGFPRFAERLHSAIVNAGLASILVNVSRKVLEQAAAAGIRREHMTVIPNGIAPTDDPAPDRPSIREELGIARGEVLILAVGRLVYQKGHEYIIEAMAEMLHEHPSVKLGICGEGALRQQLELQIERLGVGRTVRLLGNRMDIVRLLGAADIFALPSRWEGLPVALLEAMHAGLPIVATRVEGVEEVIHDDSQGLLVAPEDARGLAKSLRRLVDDPILRQQLGEGARERARGSYTLDIMCERYVSLMRNLSHRRRKAATSESESSNA
jgi:glycosyltransferase involved in cell wall biosynthesis